MENVFTVFRPLGLFLKFFGIFPKTLADPVEKGKFRTEVSDLVPSIVLFSLHCYLIYEISSKRGIQDDSLILTVAWNYSLILENCAYFIQNAYQIYHIKMIVKFLSILQEIDSFLWQIKLKLNLKNQKKIVYLAIFFFFIFNLVESLTIPIINIFLNFFKFDWKIASANYLVNFFSDLYILQLVLACCAIKQRLQCINKLLQT